ncbi:MAG TPA: DUF6428 family protein, partial [Chthoniobacterales bacterium]
MKTTEFKSLLERHPDLPLAFVLPDGSRIPAHAHVTEVGRVDKTFLDCGGDPHRDSACLLQTWVAEDLDHRLSAAKLRGIFDLAAPLLGNEELEVEVEYEAQWISQFPVESASAREGALMFQLAAKHTDCLAKES